MKFKLVGAWQNVLRGRSSLGAGHPQMPQSRSGLVNSQLVVQTTSANNDLEYVDPAPVHFDKSYTSLEKKVSDLNPTTAGASDVPSDSLRAD